MKTKSDSAMSFMQPEVVKGTFFRVETGAGTEIVPSHVCGYTLATCVSDITDYIDGAPLEAEAILECEEGYVARLSAPGYTDCTGWSAHATYERAVAYLEMMHGEEG